MYTYPSAAHLKNHQLSQKSSNKAFCADDIWWWCFYHFFPYFTICYHILPSRIRVNIRLPLWLEQWVPSPPKSPWSGHENRQGLEGCGSVRCSLPGPERRSEMIRRSRGIRFFFNEIRWFPMKSHSFSRRWHYLSLICFVDSSFFLLGCDG